MSIWIEEDRSPGLISKTKVEKVFKSTTSQFQEIHVVDLDTLGRSLILDGIIQSAGCDEHIYHESLVHPVMCAHPNPKKVFIAGGGEGATAREVLRFRSVERCVMVDIDEVCVNLCKEHLPGHHAGAFDNPKFELVIGDAEKYVHECKEKFDVVIMDLADPQEEGPCWRMYTKEFYQALIQILNPDGVIVSQTGPAGPFFLRKFFSPVQNTMKAVFKNVRAYHSFMPSFLEPYGFTMCSNDVDFNILDAQLVDKRVAERVEGENHHYDGESHDNMFSLPKYIRKTFADETIIGTLEDPKCFLRN